MIESNIDITSNIYIRSDPDLKKDKRYIEKITGAKRIKEIKNRYYGFDSIPIDWLNQIQKIEEILSLCESYEGVINEY